MANGNTNPGSGKDDNEMRILFGMILTVLRDSGLMRIWFGLILKIMVRMKSYILPELCYLTKPIG